MKILKMVSHLNTGGITTYILNLAKEQVEAGHEVFVWGARGTCSEDFRQLGATVFDDVPRCKSELSPYLWASLPRLIRILKTQSIDMVHAHSRVTQVLVAAATLFVKVPYLSTAHMFYKRRLGRRFFPCWGKRVIAVSHVMQEGLETIFPKRELSPIVVVPNGIEVDALRAKLDQVDRMKIRESYGYRNEDLVVLSLSRLIPVKGVHVLIEAFAVARKRVPKMKLLVSGAGDAPYEQGLKARVAELDLQKEVLFLGNESQIEKPLKAADIFVAPYLWPEAFGLSALEAMAAGLPVTGSMSGGIVELLKSGQYGLLFKEGDISALSECLVRYGEDPELRSRMGALARQRSLEFTSRQMYERIQKVYEEVLQEEHEKIHSDPRVS